MAARIAGYGAALALGTGLLQWLDMRWLMRGHSIEVYLLLVALAFMALGLAVGFALLRQSPTEPPATFDGNPQARKTLGISTREAEVLAEIAAGRSNKEIARRLAVSPNTVKTHAARLFEKLGANRRLEAVNKARALGLVP